MFIDIKTNPPTDGAQVLVKLDDGTQEKSYAVARYSCDTGFHPFNIHVYKFGGHSYPPLVFDYPVIAWQPIK